MLERPFKNRPAEHQGKTFTPYLTVRHCLYLYHQEVFGPILFKGTRERFAAWLKASPNNAK